MHRAIGNPNPNPLRFRRGEVVLKVGSKHLSSSLRDSLGPLLNNLISTLSSSPFAETVITVFSGAKFNALLIKLSNT
jgi:hypothetical protein